MKALLTAIAAAFVLAGCTKLSEVGREPELSPIMHHPASSLQAAHYYPKAAPMHGSRSSLWDDRQSRLFTDPRALSTGDILTVAILINDRAQLRNQSERRRSADRDFGASGSVGFDGTSYKGDGSAKLGSSTQSAGRGQTERSEDIRMSIAAVVTDVLPNGNLIIRGSQEVRVNAELRILNIEGIVRPADIGANNTISYERIAEARISYGGRGRITEVQQPPYGQQILDAILPF
jgi:flagellar L-ring protein FlgH